MGRVIAGMASSHAFAVEDPAGWEEKRQRNRRHYADRYGEMPPEPPAIEDETPAEVAERHRRLATGFGALRRALRELQPDALILVGDDQDECFTDGNFPQVAIYVGGDFTARGILRDDPRHARRADPSLARGILETAVAHGIDMASVGTLPDAYLPAHAFGPVLQVVDPDGRIPVVPVFVNAIHLPAPSPSRCHFLGTVLRRAVECAGDSRRIVVYGSGGLSHFPSSFPRHPFPWGSIDIDFDRWAVERMRAGDGQALARLQPEELLTHGEAELRSWLAVLGAVGSARPDVLVYEPIWRGMMGMGVACWRLEDAA